jgi:hypothetical protein
MLTFRFPVATALLALAAALLAGGPAAADEGASAIKGKVALNGAPLANGRIFFHLANDQFVGAKIKDGDYAVDKVPVGTWRVTVEGQGIPAVYSADDKTPLKARVQKHAQVFDLNLSN